MAQPATRKTRMPTEENPFPEDLPSQIQALVYQLRLECGAPIGSPDEDCFEAESRLTKAGKSEQ